MGRFASRYTTKAHDEAGLTVSNVESWRFCWRNRTEICDRAVTKT
jgi:hypothetical protein